MWLDPVAAASSAGYEKTPLALEWFKNRSFFYRKTTPKSQFQLFCHSRGIPLSYYYFISRFRRRCIVSSTSGAVGSDIYSSASCIGVFRRHLHRHFSLRVVILSDNPPVYNILSLYTYRTSYTSSSSFSDF
jgi:hypothetical protein